MERTNLKLYFVVLFGVSRDGVEVTCHRKHTIFYINVRNKGGGGWCKVDFCIIINKDVHLLFCVEYFGRKQNRKIMWKKRNFPVFVEVG